jgi:Ala-tRNA(Pro) deacylase
MSTYDSLVELLDRAGVPYRELEHPPAASAAEYHRVVGSRLEQQAKALLFRRYAEDGTKSYLVFALPGSAEADVDRLRRATGSRRLRLATQDELHRQTGCRFGELPPFGSIFECELALDARLLGEEELYFNAGRLDCSIVLSPATLVAVEAPTTVWGDGCASWTLADHDDLHVQRERMPPGTTEQRHVHARVRQLYYVLSGHAVVRFDDRDEALATGGSVDVPPGTPHQIRNDSGAELEFLVVSTSAPRADRVDLDQPER